MLTNIIIGALLLGIVTALAGPSPGPDARLGPGPGPSPAPMTGVDERMLLDVVKGLEYIMEEPDEELPMYDELPTSEKPDELVLTEEPEGQLHDTLHADSEMNSVQGEEGGEENHSEDELHGEHETEEKQASEMKEDGKHKKIGKHKNEHEDSDADGKEDDSQDDERLDSTEHGHDNEQELYPSDYYPDYYQEGSRRVRSASPTNPRDDGYVRMAVWSHFKPRHQ